MAGIILICRSLCPNFMPFAMMDRILLAIPTPITLPPAPLPVTAVGIGLGGGLSGCNLLSRIKMNTAGA